MSKEDNKASKDSRLNTAREALTEERTQSKLGVVVDFYDLSGDGEEQIKGLIQWYMPMFENKSV